MSIFKNARVVSETPGKTGFSFKPKEEKEDVSGVIDNNPDNGESEGLNEGLNKENQNEEEKLQRETNNEESENEKLQQEKEVVTPEVDEKKDKEKNVEKEDLEIPDDIKPYLKYKKETGRSYEDFLELQKDWKNENEDSVLKRYLKDKNPYFTDEDIKDELSEFNYDDDLDEEVDIRKKKREKRKLLSEALNYLESQKENYKTPTKGSLDNGDAGVPDEYKQAKVELSKIQESQKQQQDLILQRQQKFLSETKSIFNEEFKGFEFEINGEKKVFKGGDANELLSKQSDINNFVKPFMNDKGEIVDVKGYHKALHAGMNVDKIAKHFYELGQSEAIANETKNSKNINMSGHRTTENLIKKDKGIKMRVVESDSNKVFGWKIRNRNK